MTDPFLSDWLRDFRNELKDHATKDDLKALWNGLVQQLKAMDAKLEKTARPPQETP